MTLPHPLLVFGPRKSGTTLLHNLLDGSDELVMIPGELKLQLIRKRSKNTPSEAARAYLERGRLDFSRMMSWQNNIPQVRTDFAFDGLDAAQTREVFDTEQYVLGLKKLLNDATSSTRIDTRQTVEDDVRAFFGAMKKRPCAAKFWASKEISSKPKIALGFWRELFPQSRIVFLVRQPEFIVRSILNDRRRKGIRLSLRTIWWHCAEVQHLINYAHQMTFEDVPQRPVFIAYEDLTTNVEGAMRRVTREIGIAFDPILARPTTLGVPMVVRTSSRSTTDVFKQEPNWRRGLEPREVRALSTFARLQPWLFRLYRGQEAIISYQTLRQRLTQINASS